MRHVVKIAALATFLAAGAAASGEPASAQEFRFRIGPDRPSVVERRVFRPRPVRRTICERKWRTIVSSRGIIRRPYEECRTITTRRRRW